jgi:alpha-1,6-mannosyltransferase
LAVLGGLTIGVWVAIAALSVCLNESPHYMETYRLAAPWPLAAADGVVGLLGRVWPGQFSTDGCEPTVLARAQVVAGVLYLLLLVILDRARASRTLLVGVVGVAVVCQLAMLAMPGLLSSDVLDYASYGRVTAIFRVNPYEVTPEDFGSDPMADYGAWRDRVTVYGPLWTRIDGTLARLLPAGDPLQLVLAYKVLALVAQVANLALVGWLASRMSVPATIAIATFSLNPLVLMELNGNAHNEALMITFMLLGLACLIVSRRPRWLAALVALFLGALVKFVPLGVGALVGLAWLRSLPGWRQRLRQGLAALGLLALLSVVVAWPWLESTAVLRPLVGVAAGGDRYKNGWQDAVAAYLAVRLLPPLGIPATLTEMSENVSRGIAWGATRLVFAVYLLFEMRNMWRNHADVRAVVEAGARVMLLAVLLLLTQVLAWYFIWPLPMAALLGWRNVVTKAAVAFAVVFLPAYYLREFQPYGVFYLPVYLGAALAVFAVTWLIDQISLSASPESISNRAGSVDAKRFTW